MADVVRDCRLSRQESAGARLRTRAYAKVNFALEVLGRRSDGFHELVSVTQTISLHDVVECGPAPALKVKTRPPVVGADHNLAGAAARLLACETGHPAALELLIAKRIPLAAGLGGGSSNAASALRLMNLHWGAPLRSRDLRGLAAKLGSDVPLFLLGGAALVEGRGERVTALRLRSPVWLALAVPPIQLADKTRRLYQALTADDWSEGSRTRALAAAIQAGHGPLSHGSSSPNAFDRPAEAAYPGFVALRERLADAVGARLQLSGAGPGLFALFATRGEANAAARRMTRAGVPARVARSIAGLPRIRAVQRS